MFHQETHWADLSLSGPLHIKTCWTWIQFSQTTQYILLLWHSCLLKICCNFNNTYCINGKLIFKDSDFRASSLKCNWKHLSCPQKWFLFSSSFMYSVFIRIRFASILVYGSINTSSPLSWFLKFTSFKWVVYFLVCHFNSC